METDKKWLREGYEWLQILSVLLVVLIGCFAFLFTLVRVDGSSMYPTLEHGDMMIVNRMDRGLETGDVVVLRREDSYGGNPLVKRVIATSGQTVLIDYEANTITVDGVVLDEPYLNYAPGGMYGDDFMYRSVAYLDEYADQPFVVPDGCVFVCGDNRNDSGDSRSAELGMVDQRCVMGRVMVIVWPVNRIDIVE